MDSPDALDPQAPPAATAPPEPTEGRAPDTRTAREPVPGRAAALAVLFAGTALLLATLVQPAAAAAGRWAARHAAHRSLARDASDGLSADRMAPSRPCALPEWHPQVDCSEAPGRSFHGLALPPGHPPIDARPELPLGHPPIDGFERAAPDGEVRPIPAPALPARSPLDQPPRWI